MKDDLSEEIPDEGRNGGNGGNGRLSDSSGPTRAKSRRMLHLAVTGLAVAAVAGVAIAGSAAARSGRPNASTPVDSAAAGSGQGATTPKPTPDNATPGVSTPSPTPANATPGVSTPTLTPSNTNPDVPTPTPTPGNMTPGLVTKGPGKVNPQPKEQALPGDPVAACKKLLASSGERPGRNAKVVARLDGSPGTVLVLADSHYWAGCDTAYARHDGQGSIRQPAGVAKPSASDADAFAVANNIIPTAGKDYEYFWAAGLLPAGVGKISYTFPDGVTTSAIVKGNYWLMQHRTASPWVEGADANQSKIAVTLSRADGSPLRTFHLAWGTQTCAQISHGC
jgi:hypothetical protein